MGGNLDEFYGTGTGGDLIMATQAPIIFGRYKQNITPQATSVRGMSGWWTVPSGWFMQPANVYNPAFAPSETVASPNPDFSGPVYFCTLADDGMTMAFQDTLLNKYTR